jgi:dienelactone hydrolase
VTRFKRLNRCVIALVLAASACAAPTRTGIPLPVAEPPGAKSNGESSTDFLSEARNRASAEATSLSELKALLQPYLRVYKPPGPGRFPTILFLHGCSGPTLSHEAEWADFYTGLGAAVIAVDSLAPRNLAEEPVCNLEALTGRERAADVLAILDYARALPFVDPHRMALTGFSHGAWTIWELFVLASHRRPPLGLQTWPESSLDGVRAAFLFYGPCLENWTVSIPTVVFLAEADRYIDEENCLAEGVEENPGGMKNDELEFRVFENATHTFDHAHPNQSNRAAGSVYDPIATRAVRTEIRSRWRLLMSSPPRSLSPRRLEK